MVVLNKKSKIIITFTLKIITFLNSLVFYDNQLRALQYKVMDLLIRKWCNLKYL